MPTCRGCPENERCLAVYGPGDVCFNHPKMIGFSERFDIYLDKPNKLMEMIEKRSDDEKEWVNKKPSGKRFEGAPCKTCGKTTRYESNNLCVACKKRTAARYHAKIKGKPDSGGWDDYLFQRLI